uniref:Uncharacterized protein n=1 Tax=Pipistrellus kuhlii TaxID=59472 RepID=A0A7J7VBH7_PIPKU|nr:hypothetical protein mPipKuh1_008475 [Pipistrellus kuhlii]
MKKINKHRCNGREYETCWICCYLHWLNYFYFIVCFFLSWKRWLRLGSGPGRGTPNAPGSPGGRPRPVLVPEPRELPGAALHRGPARAGIVPGAFGSGTRLSFAPHCAHFREKPAPLQPHFSGSPLLHPGGRASSPPPSSPRRFK